MKKTVLDAYNCERELLLNLIAIEEIGVRINAEALKKEIQLQTQPLEDVGNWIKQRLGSPEINLNSPKQIVSALISQEIIDVEKAELTPTGQISTGGDSLASCVTDVLFVAMYRYRTQLKTCMNTFMIPWYTMAFNNGGVLYTTWHQTASASESGDSFGARTGRLSSSPNFQNQPKKYKALFLHEDETQKHLPKCPIGNLPPMPIMRSFIIPRFDDHVLIDLDYSQQEIRILAHFEDGAMMKAYKDDPTMDVHELAIKLLYDNLGKEVSRDTVKIIAFSIIYGKWNDNLAKDLGCSVEEAAELRDAYYKIFPGVQEVDELLKEYARKDLPFRTLGGRLVKCEPPIRNKKGKLCDLSYKMINTECQGSAGDATKMAINNYMRLKPENHHLLLSVHDEILCSVPEYEVETGRQVLKEAMESVPCDVLLLAEGKEEGATSWDLLK